MAMVSVNPGADFGAKAVAWKVGSSAESRPEVRGKVDGVRNLRRSDAEFERFRVAKQ
jgi:hypothetical protein